MEVSEMIVGWKRAAYDLGVEQARAAAGWCVDGNTSEDHVRRVLAMLEDGDPEAYDLLPARPDLSEEWADSMTPRRLFEEVTGLDAHLEASYNYDAYEGVSEELCSSFEDAVSDTFETACETELRKVAAA